MPISAALVEDPEFQVGDFIEEPLEPIDFGASAPRPRSR